MPVALLPRRQPLKQGQPSPQMADCFHVCRALGGMLAGAPPVTNRHGGQPGLREVVRKQLGRGSQSVREAFLERLGDPGVQLLALAAQQAVVGRVPHQRVLEDVGRVRRHAAAEDQLGRDQPVQSARELRLSASGETAASSS